METYPPMFLSASSSPPPFMAMNMMSPQYHPPTTSKVDGELVTSTGFLGLMTSMEAQAPSTSNYNNNDEGASSGHDDSRHKSLVSGGSTASDQSGEPKIASGGRKGDHYNNYPKVNTNAKTSKGKVRKPRYAFQTRSHVDILDDGYRWRKYGQKAVKNNKFPRSYYRCTFQGCNVKKQVQRLTRDEEVVVTTYEGMHSHPIERSTDNFEHILSQFQIFNSI